jgi:hypothetical protein
MLVLVCVNDAADGDDHGRSFSHAYNNLSDLEQSQARETRLCFVERIMYSRGNAFARLTHHSGEAEYGHFIEHGALAHG